MVNIIFSALILAKHLRLLVVTTRKSEQLKRKQTNNEQKIPLFNHPQHHQDRGLHRTAAHHKHNTELTPRRVWSLNKLMAHRTTSRGEVLINYSMNMMLLIVQMNKDRSAICICLKSSPRSLMSDAWWKQAKNHRSTIEWHRWSSSNHLMKQHSMSRVAHCHQQQISICGSSQHDRSSEYLHEGG